MTGEPLRLLLVAARKLVAESYTDEWGWRIMQDEETWEAFVKALEEAEVAG